MQAIAGPERGHEMEVWTGAGGDPIGTPGVTLGNSIWNLGVRYGWVLTDPHGPGFLRGRFEYAVDAIPALMVFQPGGRDVWIWLRSLDHEVGLQPTGGSRLT